MYWKKTLWCGRIVFMLHQGWTRCYTEKQLCQWRWDRRELFGPLVWGHDYVLRHVKNCKNGVTWISKFGFHGCRMFVQLLCERFELHVCLEWELLDSSRCLPKDSRHCDSFRFVRSTLREASQRAREIWRTWVHIFSNEHICWANSELSSKCWSLFLSAFVRKGPGCAVHRFSDVAAMCQIVFLSGGLGVHQETC